MVFSGEPYMKTGAVCGAVDTASLKPVSGRVEIEAAFCYSEDILSGVHVAYPQGSPQLGDAVTQVVLNLFPLYDSTIDHDGDNDLVP